MRFNTALDNIVVVSIRNDMERTTYFLYVPDINDAGINYLKMNHQSERFSDYAHNRGVVNVPVDDEITGVQELISKNKDAIIGSTRDDLSENPYHFPLNIRECRYISYRAFKCIADFLSVIENGSKLSENLNHKYSDLVSQGNYLFEKAWKLEKDISMHIKEYYILDKAIRIMYPENPNYDYAMNERQMIEDSVYNKNLEFSNQHKRFKENLSVLKNEIDSSESEQLINEYKELKKARNAV